MSCRAIASASSSSNFARRSTRLFDECMITGRRGYGGTVRTSEVEDGVPLGGLDERVVDRAVVLRRREGEKEMRPGETRRKKKRRPRGDSSTETIRPMRKEGRKDNRGAARSSDEKSTITQSCWPCWWWCWWWRLYSTTRSGTSVGRLPQHRDRYSPPAVRLPAPVAMAGGFPFSRSP